MTQEQLDNSLVKFSKLGILEIVKMLVENGANVDLESLFWAKMKNYLEVNNYLYNVIEKENKMAKRIKFNYDTEKMQDASYGMSRQTFRINGQDLRLFVHFKDYYFEVVDQEGNAVKKGGKTKNRAVLLRQAKRALENMGYEFDQETRNRGNKVEAASEENQAN